MQSKIYLSIDLDFWAETYDYEHMSLFLKRCMETSVEIKIVDSHETLLNHVNSSGCTDLINVDFHADIYDRWSEESRRNKQTHDFNCGTWVNYVRFRDYGTYTWFYPYPHSQARQKGYCHSWGDGRACNPFVNPSLAGWRNANHIFSLQPEKQIKWENVIAIGIAYSYDWLSNNDRIVNIAKRILGYKPPHNPKAKIH